MSKRITMLLTNAFDPDPRVYKEAVYLVGRGFPVTILCWDRTPERGYPEHETRDGIELVRFPIPSVAGSGKKQLGAFFAYIKACRAYLKAHPCDYYHCNDIDGAIVWRLARHSRKTPMVFDMHELYEDVGTGHALRRRVWRRATIYFIRRSIAALYENDLYLREPYRSVRDRLAPLKNYPDAELLRPLPKTRSEVFRIGYHGTVRTQIPEFTTLFEAVKGMEDVRVDIHGGGVDLAALRELEKGYENVHIHGPFTLSELPDLYADTDIVYAGYRPWSDTRECAEVVKFFECILTGTPIILTACYTSMAERVNRLGFGLTCDTLDVEAVRAAIVRLKDDRAFREQCAANEKEHAPEYDWREAVKVLDRVYRA